MVGIILLLPFAALGQVTTADIVGNVTDPTGASIPNATITVSNTDSPFTRIVTSGASGEYAVNLVPIGHYSVRIGGAGFKADVIPVDLNAGDRVRVDAALQVGSVGESVNVTAETAALQADSSQVNSTVASRDVEALPLNGRNFVNLVQIQPGVNPGTPGSMASGTRPDERRQTSAFSANGQPDFFNSQYLDGLDNNERIRGFLGIRPSAEAIAEIQVSTNLFTAEVGRTAGAVVNVLSKSGSNRFHGSAYEYFRNDVLDARDYFARVGVIPKPEYRQNQFGGSIGGFIVRNRTFFFADIESLRIVQGVNPVTSTVPTLYEQNNPGDFSDLNNASCGNLNPAPIAALNPVGLAYFKMYPHPNISHGTGLCVTNNGEPVANNFIYSPIRLQNSLTGDVRVDQHFSDRDTFFVRYSYNPVTTETPGILPPTTVNGLKVQPGGGDANGTSVTFPGHANEVAQGVHLNYLHVFTPAVVLELKAGWTRINIQSLPLNTGTNVGNALGIPHANITSVTSGLPLVEPSSYTNLGDAEYIPIIDIGNTFQYQAALSWQKGRHSFKFGGALIRQQANFFQMIEAGRFDFSPTNGFYSPLYNLLQGQATSVTRVQAIYRGYWRLWEPFGYVQDDWRLSPRLTVNLGLRYEVNTPFNEAHHRYSNFDLGTLAFRIASDSDPTAGVNTDYRNFSPRVGFAYSPTAADVIRGGYGISYTAINQPDGTPQNNTPFAFNFGCTVGGVGASGCPSTFGNLSQGLPIPVTGDPSVVAGGLNSQPHAYPTPYVHMYNLFVQHQFGRNDTFTLGYVGQQGREFPLLLDRNRPLPSTVPGVQNPLVYASQLPGATSITTNTYAGVNNYNAMQVIYSHSLSAGLTLNANYTWAHGLGDYPSPGLSYGVPHGLVPTDVHYDYGNSDLDIRNRIAASYVYALPFFSHATGPKSLLLAGWQTNGIVTWQTGLPFGISDGAFGTPARINIPTVGSDRPNQLRVASYNRSRSNLANYLDVTAFAPQNTGALGNARVNQTYGQRWTRTDLSFFKTFPLSEQIKLQFRAEGFNVFNQPYFSQPGNTITTLRHLNGNDLTASELNALRSNPVTPSDIVASTTGGFGAITSTAPGSIPRQLQFALKILF